VASLTSKTRQWVTARAHGLPLHNHDFRLVSWNAPEQQERCVRIIKAKK